MLPDLAQQPLDRGISRRRSFLPAERRGTDASLSQVSERDFINVEEGEFGSSADHVIDSRAVGRRRENRIDRVVVHLQVSAVPEADLRIIVTRRPVDRVTLNSESSGETVD